jgi:hypothetical protein
LEQELHLRDQLFVALLASVMTQCPAPDQQPLREAAIDLALTMADEAILARRERL